MVAAGAAMTTSAVGAGPGPIITLTAIIWPRSRGAATGVRIVVKKPLITTVSFYAAVFSKDVRVMGNKGKSPMTINRSYFAISM